MQEYLATWRALLEGALEVTPYEKVTELLRARVGPPDGVISA